MSRIPPADWGAFSHLRGLLGGGREFVGSKLDNGAAIDFDDNTLMPERLTVYPNPENPSDVAGGPRAFSRLQSRARVTR